MLPHLINYPHTPLKNKGKRYVFELITNFLENQGKYLPGDEFFKIHYHKTINSWNYDGI